MKNTSKRIANIIKVAVELGFVIDTGTSVESLIEGAEEFIRENAIAERYECDVESNGHSQRVDFGDFWSQGQIVDFSAHWHKAPNTEIDHESFVDNEGKLIQLYYVIGETDYNAPDGFYFDRKTKKHIAFQS